MRDRSLTHVAGCAPNEPAAGYTGGRTRVWDGPGWSTAGRARCAAWTPRRVVRARGGSMRVRCVAGRPVVPFPTGGAVAGDAC